VVALAEAISRKKIERENEKFKKRKLGGEEIKGKNWK
jgi:hypothetical protein